MRIKYMLLSLLIVMTIVLYASCSGEIGTVNTSDGSTTTLKLKESSSVISETRGSDKSPITDRILTNNTQKIAYSYNTEDEISRVIHTIMIDLYVDSNGTHNYKEVEEVLSIKQLRYCTKTNYKYYYSVHECSGLGKLFVFYKEYQGDYLLYKSIFFSKQLLFSSFNSIQVGVSTYKDVVKIDPATEFILKNYDVYYSHSTEEAENHIDYSIHMTKEGYVQIGYKTKNGIKYVASVNKVNDELISSINSLDLIM